MRRTGLGFDVALVHGSHLDLTLDDQRRPSHSTCRGSEFVPDDGGDVGVFDRLAEVVPDHIVMNEDCARRKSVFYGEDRFKWFVFHFY